MRIFETASTKNNSDEFTKIGAPFYSLRYWKDLVEQCGINFLFSNFLLSATSVVHKKIDKTKIHSKNTDKTPTVQHL